MTYTGSSTDIILLTDEESVNGQFDTQSDIHTLKISPNRSTNYTSSNHVAPGRRLGSFYSYVERQLHFGPRAERTFAEIRGLYHSDWRGDAVTCETFLVNYQ